jgi:fructose-1,6-bisphosphatase II
MILAMNTQPQPGASALLPAPTKYLHDAVLAAAKHAWPLVGSGDKNNVDGEAVAAMRAVLNAAEFGGIVMIGEGEKDEAPMLFNGEQLGLHAQPDWDIAVDPIDGTALAAAGVPGAVAVISASPRGTMLGLPDVYYMQKLISGPAGIGLLDLDLSARENVRRLAGALNRSVEEITVAIINKPRNYDLIAEVQSIGAKWHRFDEGDVAWGVAAASPDSEIDLLVGLGGNPEGVLTACAVRALGGFMQGRLAVDSADELARAQQVGIDLERKLELTDLVGGDRWIFAMAQVTDGALGDGITAVGGGLRITSYVVDSALPNPLIMWQVL